jgi:GAF domain-containing protein
MAVKQSSGGSADANWQELCRIVDELAEKAKNAPDEPDFFNDLAEHLRKLLEVPLVDIWSVDESSIPRLLYESARSTPQFPTQPELHAVRSVVVQDVTRAARPTVISDPRFSHTDVGARRLLYPIEFGARVRHVVEVFGREFDADRDLQRHLPVVAQLCSLSEDFYRIHELSRLRELHAIDAENDNFARRIHSSVRLQATAYQLANEARRLLQCDRVSVAGHWGKRVKLLAVSGQDSIHHRSNVVRTMRHLISRVLHNGTVFRFDGGPLEASPDLERALAAYLRESNAKSIAIVPLSRPIEEFGGLEAGSLRHPEPNGALVVEQFEGQPLNAASLKRLEFIAVHAGSALENAITYEKLLPLSLGGVLGEWFWALKADHGRKFAAAAIVVLAIVAALVFIPAEFSVQAEGTLQPKSRRNVFARSDGIVETIEVDHGAIVAADQPLVKLRNPDLEFRLSSVLGELQTTAKKLSALKTSRLDKGFSTPTERSQSNDAAGGELELTAWLTSLERQHEILLRQKEDLIVRSPIRGQVVTWNVAETLPSKPVTRGETLMTIDDLEGEWNLEILMPDGRMGHLLAARERRPEVPLEVSFILATAPNIRYQGRVSDIMLSAEPNEKLGNTVLIKVDLDSKSINVRRPGAEVTARIACGKRSLGYVWFHELAEFFHSQILFRF